MTLVLVPDTSTCPLLLRVSDMTFANQECFWWRLAEGQVGRDGVTGAALRNICVRQVESSPSVSVLCHVDATDSSVKNGVCVCHFS